MKTEIQFGNPGDNYVSDTAQKAAEGDIGAAAEVLMTLAGYAPTDYGPCQAPSNATREQAEMALRVIASALGLVIARKDDLKVVVQRSDALDHGFVGSDEVSDALKRIDEALK